MKTLTQFVVPRENLVYPKTPMKGDQVKYRTLPVPLPLERVPVPEAGNFIMPRPENVNPAPVKIPKPAPEEIVYGKTVKPLEREGKDYDPEVKALFRGREHENVYINKQPQRKTAMEMLDEVCEKEAKEGTSRYVPLFRPLIVDLI